MQADAQLGGDALHPGIGERFAADHVAGPRERRHQREQCALHAGTDQHAIRAHFGQPRCEPARTGFAICRTAAEILIAQQRIEIHADVQMHQPFAHAFQQIHVARLGREIHGHFHQAVADAGACDRRRCDRAHEGPHPRLRFHQSSPLRFRIAARDGRVVEAQRVGRGPQRRQLLHGCEPAALDVHTDEIGDRQIGRLLGLAQRSAPPLEVFTHGNDGRLIAHQQLAGNPVRRTLIGRNCSANQSFVLAPTARKTASAGASHSFA